MIDLRDAIAMYVGNKPVKQVYLGGKLVKDFVTIQPPVDEPPIDEPEEPTPTVYVQVVTSNPIQEDVLLNCTGTLEVRGIRRKRPYVFNFYSDAARTVPMSVANLVLNIKIGQKSTYGGAFTYATSQITVNGTSHTYSSSYLIYEAYTSCNGTNTYFEGIVQVDTGAYVVNQAAYVQPSPPVFIEPEEPIELTLKNLTSKFGMAIRADKLNTTAYTDILKKDCRVIGAESAFKPDKIGNVRGQITNTADAEAIAAFARDNNIDLHGHCAVWGKTNQMPAWVKALAADPNLTGEDWKLILKEAVQTMTLYFVSLGCKTMDVVNEPFNETDDINAMGIYRDCIWYNKLGPQYVPLSFQYAHEVAPDLELYLTEYGQEFGGSKMTAYFGLANEMVANGIPIHGLGYQTHVRIGNSRSSIKNGLLRGIATGLKVSITEFDMSVRKDQPVGYTLTPELEETQSQRILETYLDFNALPESKKGFFMSWGVYDGQSWLREEGNGDFALLFKKDYSPKKAVQYMIDSI